jgi:cyclophilin family peptidyl-prolyl cis-trans isomerase
MHEENRYSDGKYAASGKLIEGESTLDKIADTPVESNPYSPQEISVPEVDVIIKEVSVLEKYLQ